MREFTVPGEYTYNRLGPLRWILSHLFRYKPIVFGFLFLSLITNVLHSVIDTLIGVAFTIVQQGEIRMLIIVALGRLGIEVLAEIANIGAGNLAAVLGQCIARDVRDELYLSLLSKSQTFHNRQRVGDIMAHAANDADLLNNMILPGLYVTIQSYGGMLIALCFIAFLNLQLLLVPCLYMACLFLALRPYQKQFQPVAKQMREHFGETNAVLTEAVTGIETIKATTQEKQEQHKFEEPATQYREFFEKTGLIQGRYFPKLMLGIFLALAFLHSLLLLSQGVITLGILVAFMSLLVGNLRYVTDISLSGFSLIQTGVASAKRILNIMQEEKQLDENIKGHCLAMQGDVVFDKVSFNYGETPILKHISFHAEPSKTVAIVGQTGGGKSTLTKIINRIYDVSEGNVLIDGVDVRDWNLDTLRSQIATIEQDIFLFSRTIAENIAYGLGQRASQAAIEKAARDAQAHDFIMSFEQGYDTLVGERGVMLSGGQRQRIAIARALLTDPRILILDDATSAIDSATEDEIQKAIQQVLQGRTTFLITHRLSEIRRADIILVLQEGELIDQGTHEELLDRCGIYRRIFSH